MTKSQPKKEPSPNEPFIQIVPTGESVVIIEGIRTNQT